MDEWLTIEPGDPPIVSLRCDVDYSNADDLRHAIEQLAEDGHRCVVVDLQATHFMESSGISALISAARRLEPMGLILRSPAPSVIHALHVSGLDRFFSIEDEPSRATRAEAPNPGQSRAGRVELQGSPAVPELRDGRVAERILRYPARLLSVARIRDQVVDLGRILPFTAEELDDIRMAVGEACSNAVRHGSPHPERDVVVISVRVSHDTLEIEVRDCGPGFIPESVPLPLLARGGSPMDATEGGMGLYFMRLLMDEVEISCNGGTRVRMVKRPSAIE